MANAVWNGKVIAESDKVVELEGNVYFPRASVKKEFLVSSSYRTTCFWKGEASYYHVEVDNLRQENAAWFYATPPKKALQIKEHIAFWKGITITR